MPALLCPVCRKTLTKTEKTYFCPNGHSFDRAKSGYVNLLRSSAKGKRHGDDKLMVKARTAFLNGGYYARLSKEIAACVERYAPKTVQVLDAGCGEGTYTLDVLRHLTAAGKKAEIVGVDISKEALHDAARRSDAIQLAVASCADLPLADQSVDVLLNVFAPFVQQEFFRVLRPGGVLIRVYPLEKHLWELKELIYDTPYENRVTDMEETGFTILERRKLCYRIHLEDPAMIMNLFRMTPYYYKTGLSDQKKAEQATVLDTEVAFGILIYERRADIEQQGTEP